MEVSICQYTEEIKIENPINRYFNLPIKKTSRLSRCHQAQEENPDLEKRTQCKNQEKYNQEKFLLDSKKSTMETKWDWTKNSKNTRIEDSLESVQLWYHVEITHKLEGPTMVESHRGREKERE